MSRHCTIPTSTRRRGTGFGPATRHGSSAATVLPSRVEACRVIAQSRLLREGEDPVLDRQHATAHPLLPSFLAALKHVASLHNPDFYEKERIRFWTGNTPRLIRCYRPS